MASIGGGRFERFAARVGKIFDVTGQRERAVNEYRQALRLRPDPDVERKLSTLATAPSPSRAQFRLRYDGGINEPLGTAALEVLGGAYDNNLLCISEKEVFAVASIFDDLMATLAKYKAVQLNAAQVAALTQAAFVAAAGGTTYYVIRRQSPQGSQEGPTDS